MITYVHGNIFDSTCEALVNAVNTKGIMGAGLAKQFKDRYPQMFEAYVKACQERVYRPGHVEAYCIPNERFILNVATKDDWRNPSKLEWVADGIVNLRQTVENFQLASVAIPKIGCGLGGLDWNDVHRIIVNVFENYEGLVEIYGENPLNTQQI